MKKNQLPTVLSLVLLFLGVLVLLQFKNTPLALSATTHLVISEIQQRSISNSDDEFVELYNPTETPVDLTGWRLTKRPQDGSPETNIVASMSGSIPAHGFFLITNDEAIASTSADLVYNAAAIAADNTITLYDDLTAEIDLVGMGDATASESSPAANPPNGGSIERKAFDTSTSDSMRSGGDHLAGNGQDTDHNENDFAVQETSEPQNSSSQTEPVVEPSPSPTPTPEASPTPAPTPSPTPSPSEEPGPSPTVEPSPSPSISPTPSASPESTPSPSASPSEEPSPSESPSVSPSPTTQLSASPSPSASPSVSPSPSPSPTPPGDVIFAGRLFTCRVHYRPISTRFFSFFIPQIRCSLNAS